MIKVAIFLTLAIWLFVAVVTTIRRHAATTSLSVVENTAPVPTSLFQPSDDVKVINNWSEAHPGKRHIRLRGCVIDKRALDSLWQQYDRIELQDCRIGYEDGSVGDVTDFDLKRNPDGIWRTENK